MKQCLISPLKPLIILGEIQSRSSPDFQIIKITFANLLRGSQWIIDELENGFSMESDQPCSY